MPTNIDGFIWWVLLTVIGVCGFLAIRTLAQIDKNQTELFNRMQDVEGRLSNLEGQHNAVMGMGGHKK